MNNYDFCEELVRQINFILDDKKCIDELTNFDIFKIIDLNDLLVLYSKNGDDYSFYCLNVNNDLLFYIIRSGEQEFKKVSKK